MKTRTITDGELLALEADGWVVTASMETNTGTRVYLRRGDEERFETLVPDAGGVL